MVEGHNGEVLTRRKAQVGDRFFVDPSDIPQGWSYQWNVVTVAGKDMIEEQNGMYENGWRPVPASRHPGKWTKPDYEGAIIVEGLRLEERPEALTHEALEESEFEAKRRLRDQTKALGMVRDQLPQGSMNGQRGTGANVRISIDKSLELPPGEYDLE